MPGLNDAAITVSFVDGSSMKMALDVVHGVTASALPAMQKGQIFQGSGNC